MKPNRIRKLKKPLVSKFTRRVYTHWEHRWVFTYWLNGQMEDYYLFERFLP